jgi:hypothetical protein
MAQAGLSFLSSGYDGSNPYAALQSNLGGIPRLQMAQAAAARAANSDNRAEKKEASQEELAAMLATILQSSAGPEREGTSRVARGAAKVIR